MRGYTVSLACQASTCKVNRLLFDYWVGSAAATGCWKHASISQRVYLSCATVYYIPGICPGIWSSGPVLQQLTDKYVLAVYVRITPAGGSRLYYPNLADAAVT